MNLKNLTLYQILTTYLQKYLHCFLVKATFLLLDTCKEKGCFCLHKRVRFTNFGLFDVFQPNTFLFFNNICSDLLLISACFIVGTHYSQKDEANFISPVYDITHLHLLVYNCCRYQFIIDCMFWMCHP